MNAPAALTRYAALLRGVNVGGVSMKMTDVTEAFADAGFDSVRTVLASGNVVFDGPAEAPATRATVERALRERFGYDSWTVVLSLEAVRAASDAFPFERDVPGSHSYVTFVGDDARLDELGALPADPAAGERLARGDGVLYWQVPRGATLRGGIGTALSRARYGPISTTRNLRTLEKVLRA